MKTANISDESKALHKLYKDGVIDDETLDDSMSGLALLPPKETALAVYSKPNGLDPYLDSVKDKISEFKANPPPLNTDKGRKQYSSMARKVASFKTALDAMGKELVDELKDTPKKVDAERKRIRELLDSWRDDVRKPLDDWQIEQDAIAAKIEAERIANELLKQIENDHEIGLLLNAEYDRKFAEEARVAEQARIDHEARIAREAAEQATREAEEKAAQAQRDSQLAIEKAQREKLEAENAKLLAEQKAADDLRIAGENAERARLKAIDDARIAQETADRNARLAAEKAETDRLQAIENERLRVAAIELQAKQEQEARERNTNHKKTFNNEAMHDLIAIVGLTEQQAKDLIVAIVQDKISHITIKY